MARPRASARRDWPAGLKESRPGYFTLRIPGVGERAIGRMSLESALFTAERVREEALEWLQLAQDAELQQRVKRMKAAAYSRAKSRARLFDREVMSAEEFEAMWTRAGGLCELTRIRLEPRPSGWEGGVYPWTASIDRIDRTQGYAARNSRVVCAAVNMALNQFGEDVLARIAHSIFTSRNAPVT